MISTPPIMAHERLLPAAERAGRQLIHSWILHRPRQLNHFEPDHFPTGVLQEVACGVLHGMNSEGVRDLAGLMAYFSDAPEAVRAEMLECTQDFAPMPTDCGPVIHKLREYDRALQFEKLSHRLQHALANGKPTAEIIKASSASKPPGRSHHADVCRVQVNCLVHEKVVEGRRVRPASPSVHLVGGVSDNHIKSHFHDLAHFVPPILVDERIRVVLPLVTAL